MIPAVKICGISTFESYHLCSGLGVDWVGFVFFPASPRHLSLVQARQLAEQADDQIDAQTRPRRVALCVDASDDELADIIDAARPHMLQLHGSETAERVQEIKSKFSLPVMPVIKVASKDDISQAAAFADCADWILFDARMPPAQLMNLFFPAAWENLLTGAIWQKPICRCPSCWQGG